MPEAGSNPVVWALNASEHGLIIGGAFHEIGGIAATNIAQWTGQEWRPLGGGRHW